MLRLAVSVGLLGWLACRTDWQQIGRVCAHLRLELWLAAVGLYVLSQVVSSVRWRLLARPLGFERSLGQLLSFYFVGMYFNLFLPTAVGGDVVRAWYLDGNGGRRTAAFLSVFVDRCSGLLILVGLACVAAAWCPIAVPHAVLTAVWCTAACAVLGLSTLPLAARWSVRFSRLRPLVEAARFYLGHPRLLLAALGISVVVQAAGVLLVWLVGRAIDAPVPAAYYWILVPMVTLLTMAPFSLNGMGIREGAMVLFLRPLGIPESTALTLAFLWFAVYTAASLAGGAVYLLGCFRARVQSHHGPIGHHSHQGRTRQFKTAA